MSEMDRAYQILKDKGETLHYKVLLVEAFQQGDQQNAPSTSQMARLHTQLNLDARFVHMGQGAWGLRDWAPKRPARGGVPSLIQRYRDDDRRGHHSLDGEDGEEAEEMDSDDDMNDESN